MLEFRRDGAELIASALEQAVIAKLRHEFAALDLRSGGGTFDLSRAVLAPSEGLQRVLAIKPQDA